MLFSVDRENKIVLNPDSVKICPGLKDLSEEDLLFIILGWDYKSPYHQFPEEERIRKASKEVYGKVSETKVKDLADAIEMYQSLQFDSRRETVMNYKKKIVQMNDLLMTENSPRVITQLSDAIDNMIDRAEKVQSGIDRDEHAIQLKGGGGLTYIEQWQRRQQFLKNKERSGVEYLG